METCGISFSPDRAREKNSQMPRHLISDAHEWINEIPTVPIYYPAKPQLRERAKHNQRGKKTLLSLTVNNGAQTKSMMPTPERLEFVIFGFSVAKLVEKDIKTSKNVIKFIFFGYIREKKRRPKAPGAVFGTICSRVLTTFYCYFRIQRRRKPLLEHKKFQKIQKINFLAFFSKIGARRAPFF